MLPTPNRGYREATNADLVASQTPQVLAAEYHYASLWRRGLALAIDALLVGLLARWGYDFAQRAEVFLPNGWLWVMLAVMVCGYSGVTIASRMQSTLGGWLLGIQLVRAKDFGRVGPWRAVVRSLASGFSSLGGLGYIIGFLYQDNRTLHDIIAQTRVVVANKVSVFGVAVTLVLMSLLGVASRERSQLVAVQDLRPLASTVVESPAAGQVFGSFADLPGNPNDIAHHKGAPYEIKFADSDYERILRSGGLQPLPTWLGEGAGVFKGQLGPLDLEIVVEQIKAGERQLKVTIDGRKYLPFTDGSFAIGISDIYVEDGSNLLASPMATASLARIGATRFAVNFKILGSDGSADQAVTAIKGHIKALLPYKYSWLKMPTNQIKAADRSYLSTQLRPGTFAAFAKGEEDHLFFVRLLRFDDFRRVKVIPVSLQGANPVLLGTNRYRIREIAAGSEVAFATATKADEIWVGAFKGTIATTVAFQLLRSP